MSLLLDALRKSERRRNSGAPPPLGLPSDSRPSNPSLRVTRRGGPAVAVILVVLLVLMAGAWWFGGRPGPTDLRAFLDRTADVAQVRDRELVGDAADASAAETAGEAIGEEEESEVRLVAPEFDRGPSSTGMERRTEAPSDIGDGAGTGAADDADAMPSPSASSPTALQPQSPQARSPSPAPSDAHATAPPEPLDDADVERGRAEPRALPPEERIERSSAREGRPDPSAERREPAASGSPPAEARDDTITPWQLPAALRSEFPAIDVSVHVFATDPADRFVLVGGERFTEGDRLTEGVQLEEIRPRGIVVGFRNYRILVE